MIGYSVLSPQASLRFVFNRVLPSFPAAGTDSFAGLCQALEPFGLIAENISTPQLFGNRLTDTVLEFSLFGGEAVIKVGFGWIDLVCNQLTREALELVPLLLEATVKAILGDWRGTLSDSAVRVTYSAHLILSDVETVESFLATHMSEPPELSGLRRDAFQYYGSIDAASGKPQSTRLTFARSLRSPSGLFVDCFLEYKPENDPAQASVNAQSTITELLATFGLTYLENLTEASR